MKSTPRNTFRRSVLVTAVALALSAPAIGFAAGQDSEDDDASAPADATQIDTVQVVGSRIKRANVEGPSPVTVIRSEDIEAQGFNTVHDALESVAQNIGFGQNDFNSNGGFTPNAGVINLRGLGPGRTLLLINGRRANDYPFPYNGRSNFQNFNNIPAAAVDRIEILAGGASAIYGSDAVAGVVNVVLKKNFEGDELSIKGQVTQDGGADTLDVQWVGGKTGDRGSITYAFEYFDRGPLFAYQRDFMDSGADNPSPAGVNGTVGFGGYQPPIGIQIRRISATGGTLGYTQPAGYTCAGSTLYRPHNYVSSATGAVLGPGCGYDRFVAEQTVINGTEDLSGYIFGNLDLTDTLSGWASVMAFKSDAELGGGVEQWQGGPRAGNFHYDPQFPGARTFPIRAITPEAYGGSVGTFQHFQETSWELAAGLSGMFGDRFDWDLTLSKSEYNADRQRPRLTVAGATAYFLGPRLGTVGTGPYTGIAGVPVGTAVYRMNLDRFYGPITPDAYRSMSTQVRYEAQSENTLVNFAVTGDLFELPGGSAAFAAIAEYSGQSYDLDSDERILPGQPDSVAIYNLTGTGGGGERDRYAFGVEATFPVLDSLTLSAAGRYDKYDDITNVDDAVTWNAGIEWRPLENLLFRGAYATSFKAPDMHYVFSERSGSFGGVTDFTRCARDGIAASACGGAGANYNYSPFTTSQGFPGLEEETGKSWSAGVVWDITDQLSFTADYYEIELEDEVTVLSGTVILQDEYGCATGSYPSGAPFPYAAGSSYCASIAARIDRDPTNDNRLTEIRSGPVNLSWRKVTGIDSSLRYGWDTDRWGDFSAVVSWSHILEHESKVRADSVVVNVRDSNGSSDFRSRATVQLGWQKDDWSTALYVIRYGSFPRWNLNNTLVRSGELDWRAGPFTTVNLSIGKRWTENFSMRFNVNNVFDDIAQNDPTYNSYPYYWYGGSNPLGREYGLQFNYKF